MSRHEKVSVRAPFAVGDVVRTPSGREALVCAFINERAACEYLDDRDQVNLRAEHLTFVRVATVAERLRKRGRTHS